MIRESLKSRGYHVGVRFGPPAVFDKQKRQGFQIKMSEGFDWRRQEFNEHAWVLASPQADGDQRSQMKLTLQPDLLNFEEYFPISTFDLFLDNLKLILTGLVDSFAPRVLMGSGSMIRLTVNAPGGDSRLFLGNRCLNLQERLTPLNRPVHALGLRFVLPPIDTGGQPTWQGEIKIESLVEDVSQLFVEVDAKWAVPQAWSIDTVVDRAKIAHEFATERVVSFLEQFESA